MPERDYHQEYLDRVERAHERGFESFYEERVAGPGAVHWADEIADGAIGAETAGAMIDAGIGDPDAIESLTFDIDDNGNISVEIVDADGNVYEIPVDSDTAWDELYEWAVENGYDVEVQYE